MTGEEALSRIRSKLQQTAEETPAAKALIEKIRSGKATYADTSLYARWAAINLGMSLSDVICDIDLSDRAAVCKALLLDQYEDINGFIDMVQAELDSRFGIQLAPHRAPFNDERADTIGQSLADTTKPDEVIRRRARSATETAVKSMHDDRMKTEAKFRHKAGLDCRITRVAVNGCCPWCSKVAGRYVYGEEPDDIYRRHDNCDCTVTFENGRKRQDVWSKREWEAPEPGAGAGERVVFTKEQAKALQDEKKLRVFDFSSKPGGDASAVADMAYINSEAFAAKFKGKYENQAVEDAVVSACRKIIKNRNGTHYEEAFFIDAHTGQTFSYVKGKHKNGVDMPESLKKRLTNRRKSSIIMIHNHPNSSPLSTDDYTTSTKYSSLFEVVACGHNGDVYVFRDTYGTAGSLVRMIDGSVVNETVRDFRMSYTKYLSRDNTEYEARHLSWLAVMQNRGFYYERR